MEHGLKPYYDHDNHLTSNDTSTGRYQTADWREVQKGFNVLANSS
jgi:hypothetical protein